MINLRNYHQHIFTFKHRYYPIVLITSSIFLSVTFCIYTAKKQLLDHLTRIMRHYAFNMLVAFLVLSINQAFDIKESSEVGCVIIGNLLNLLYKKSEKIIVYYQHTGVVWIILFFNYYRYLATILFPCCVHLHDNHELRNI